MSTREINEMFTEFYEHTYKDIVKYVLSRCENSSDIQEIVQNIYVNYYNTLNRGVNIREPKKYLYKIAKNEMFKYYSILTRLKRHIPLFSKEEDKFLNYELEFLSEEINYDKLLCDNVWSYLRNQDIVTFKIITLYFVYDLKISQIAEELKLNESTVKSRLYRGLKHIKEKFNF